MKDAKSWGIFLSNLTRLLNIGGSNIVCIDKIAKNCLIIDIALPGDQNIIVKEQEKLDKYQDLRTEFRKLWKLKAEAVPVVVGTLGTTSHNFKFYLKKMTLLL